ncbi:hypothetical protein [Paenibacillus sp. MMS20-IR301]|uniref:hypothetical protein n=1 Tax=Paenibacillus sp. MMS20-IR301 TaxID=2895946 RepID=UPI0028EDC73C|nr:hypothetical protein [Paenibacillus sp. MMS20-IR301]WNS45461.1 hypothetical protein LOS79_09380 [Paenibacillus sp. MMS20-IR301]
MLGGCGLPVSPGELIKPPSSEASQQRDTTGREFSKWLPKNARLITPLKGHEDHAISFGDMDGDGIDEAVVVYEYSRNRILTKEAMLFRQENEAWQKITEVKGFGYGLDYAGFFDVDDDGHNELALGWSLGEAGNGLDIYTLYDNQLQLLSNNAYQGKYENPMVQQDR